MNLKRKVMSVVLSVSLFSTAMLISSANGLDEFEGVASTNIVAREEGVLGVVEEFIKTNFSYLYSEDDYKLVDSNSKVFIRYLQFRNKYRSTTLLESGETPDKYKNIKNEYKYKSIKYLNDNLVNIKVDVTTSFQYENSEEISSLTLPYEVYLNKVGSDWKVWSAKCEDDITNPFDNIENIDILSMCDIPDTSSKLMASNSYKNEKAKLDKISGLYKNEISKFYSGLNVDISNKKIDSDVKDIINSRYKNNNSSSIKERSYNGYIDRNSMYNYMMKYAKTYNNDEYLSFSGRGGDCANFGSQILYAGGATKGGGAMMDNAWRLWDTENGPAEGGYGHAWVAAKYLRGYIIRNGENLGPQGHVIRYGSSLKKGDFCFLDIHQDGGISHTTIVSTPGPNFKICSHTANHKDVPINTVHPYGKNGNYRSYVTLTALY